VTKHGLRIMPPTALDPIASSFIMHIDNERREINRLKRVAGTIARNDDPRTMGAVAEIGEIIANRLHRLCGFQTTAEMAPRMPANFDFNKCPKPRLVERRVRSPTLIQSLAVNPFHFLYVSLREPGLAAAPARTFSIGKQVQ